jgi:hypothetical protein
MSFLLLSGQRPSGIKIYGHYRVPDEISLGVSYQYRSLLGLSIEGGYNMRFANVLHINGSLFSFEDFYALPEADRGPLLRLGFNLHTGDFGFVSVSYILKKGRVRDTHKYPDHDLPSEKTHMAYMQYGLDLNYNLNFPGAVFFGGIGHRYGVFDFDIYEFNGDPTERSEQQKSHFPVLNVGVAIPIKEWHFPGE